MSRVSIAGLDKARVLAAIYNAAGCGGGMAALQYVSGDMPVSNARRLVERSIHRRSSGEISIRFDYVMGRPIKADIGDDEVESALYDRDNGEGALARAIASLREELAKEQPK